MSERLLKRKVPFEKFHENVKGSAFWAFFVFKGNIFKKAITEQKCIH